MSEASTTESNTTSDPALKPKSGLVKELDNIIYFILIIGCLLADHYLEMGDMTLLIGALLMKARAA